MQEPFQRIQLASSHATHKGFKHLGSHYPPGHAVVNLKSIMMSVSFQSV